MTLPSDSEAKASERKVLKTNVYIVYIYQNICHSVELNINFIYFKFNVRN